MNTVSNYSFWESRSGITLRWLGVLPCSIFGSIIACVATVILCLIGDILDGSFWIYWNHPETIYFEHFFTPFITSAVFSIAFVFIGGFIAPKFKRQVAFVLAILIVIPFSIMGFFAIVSHEWKFLAQCVVGIIAAAGSAFSGEFDNL